MTNPPTYWLCRAATRGPHYYLFLRDTAPSMDGNWFDSTGFLSVFCETDFNRMFPEAATLKPGECRRVRFGMVWEE